MKRIGIVVSDKRAFYNYENRMGDEAIADVVGTMVREGVYLDNECTLGLVVVDPVVVRQETMTRLLDALEASEKVISPELRAAYKAAQQEMVLNLCREDRG